MLIELRNAPFPSFSSSGSCWKREKGGGWPNIAQTTSAGVTQMSARWNNVNDGGWKRGKPTR